MRKPQFNEKRATQLASLLLKKKGGRMNVLNLMKLMYLVDREALVRWGGSFTNDQYTSMRKGMVLIETYDLLNEEESPSYWKTFISSPQEYMVNLIDEPEFNDLSKADVDLVEEIFQKYGHLNRFALIRLHHELPEWIDTSYLTVDYRTVLNASDKNEEEILEILGEMEAVSQFEQFSLR